MEPLVGGQTIKQPTFPVGGQIENQPTVTAPDRAEAASQIQLPTDGSIGFSTMSEGESGLEKDTTDNNLEAPANNTPATEAANDKWEQHYKIYVPALVGQEG